MSNLATASIVVLLLAGCHSRPVVPGTTTEPQYGNGTFYVEPTAGVVLLVKRDGNDVMIWAMRAPK